VSSRISWEPLLAPLVTDGGYDERLDDVLEQVAELTGFEAVYLYLFDESGERLHLAPARRASLATLEAEVEGGAETIGGGPALDLHIIRLDSRLRRVDRVVRGDDRIRPLGRHARMVEEHERPLSQAFR
jgi:GAF domain-containing protein